jgi:plasmid maintenance system killer protein
MIVDFLCDETEKIWRGEVSRRLPREIQQVALRKLFMLDKAQTLDDLHPRPTGWNLLGMSARDNTALESTINGESALSGQDAVHQGSKLLIIIEWHGQTEVRIWKS